MPFAKRGKRTFFKRQHRCPVCHFRYFRPEDVEECLVWHRQGHLEAKGEPWTRNLKTVGYYQKPHREEGIA